MRLMTSVLRTANGSSFEFTEIIGVLRTTTRAYMHENSRRTKPCFDA